MARLALLLAPVLAALLLPASASASAGCAETVELSIDHLGGLDDELLRIADLVGATPGTAPRLVRRGGPRRERVCASALGATPFERFAGEVVPAARPVELGALPLRLGTVWNSLRPSGENDGLLWAGRGVSQLLSGGASLRAGMLSVTLAPEVSWSENVAFPTVSTGRAGPQRFANAFYPDAIDLPQRFGAGPFVTWSPGQSSVRLERWNAAAGVSTENLWIGSGVRSSILLTNTAPGFPHVFVGTARPVDVWIGDVEALVFWGRLERSKYAYVENHPLIEGLALTYQPRWVPGLSVGGGRLMIQRWKDLGVGDAFSVFHAFTDKRLNTDPNNPAGRFDNQLLSLFFRWVFPESGVEIHGEWAREDAERDIYGIIHDPDHSQAYLIGLDKVFRTSSGLLRFSAELLQLQNRRAIENKRGVPVYYVHGEGLDITNRGQLLGSGLGPGGSAQTVAVDHYRRGGRIGGYFERILRNDEYYWEKVEPHTISGARDVELVAGVRQVLDLGAVEVSWDASFGRRWNRDFLGPTEDNLRLMLELRVPLGGGTRASIASATAPASGR